MKSLRELMDLSGRVALVTGGAGHLGLAFCEALAELGAQICVLDIAAEPAARRAAEIQKRFGVQTSGVAVDITVEADVKKAVERVVAVHGRMDILVNNAAYSPSDLPPDGLPISEQTLAQWQAQLAVILNGTFLMTRACAPVLGAHQCGSIINIASIYGLVGPDPGLYEGLGMTNEAYYAAGKGGVVQLTRYMATMMAPSVRANCIAPGGIWRKQKEAFVERYKARTPLGRMGTEEDLKGALAFLASDLSAYVTGQVLAVEGGMDGVVTGDSSNLGNMKVANRHIGNGAPCFIIAEAGVNHNGKLQTAHELVDVAAKAGADAVKFQTWITEKICLPGAKKADYQRTQDEPDEDQFSMLKALELPYEWHAELKAHAEESGILFFKHT